jgi:lysine 2,3-aminomutase
MITKYRHNISDVAQLSTHEKRHLKMVTDKYPFLASEYYLSLIDWNNLRDPLRRAVIPHLEELTDWGTLDASQECSYTIMPGLQHKYDSTALLMVSDRCAGICRYCFRKRIFMDRRVQIIQDVPDAMKYIKAHKEIASVLLTGGDPLRLETSALEDILRQLWEIAHVRTVRIGTRMPAFDPFRIIDDSNLVNLIGRYGSANNKGLYVMTHFVHPRELNDCSERAIDLLRRAGAFL